MFELKNKIVLSSLLLVYVVCYSQKNTTCINEVFAIEEKNSIRNFNEIDKTYRLDYALKTIDWENQIINSHVRAYKNKDNMHFYSDQGVIYQDEKEIYMVLPIQKIVIVNTSPKDINHLKVKDDFYEFRKKFLDSAEVVECKIIPQSPDIKVLELKINNDLGGVLHLKSMIYKYDVKAQKILSIDMFYNDKYKVKEMQITFNEVGLTDKYKFNSARKYVVDRNGKLLAKYGDYELVDNRNKKEKKN